MRKFSYIVLRRLAFLKKIDLIRVVYRYAYSEEMGEDSEEEGISLTGGGVMVAVDLATKIERKERKVSTAVDHHVFGLGEDVEEDKRE